MPPTAPTEPTPGYGDASIDPPDNKDDATITPTLKYDETLVDDTAVTQLFATISQGSYIQLYCGQKSVDQLAVFNSLDAYVTDSSFNQYEFGADSLGKYLRIDGISFNGGAGRPCPARGHPGGRDVCLRLCLLPLPH